MNNHSTAPKLIIQSLKQKFQHHNGIKLNTLQQEAAKGTKYWKMDHIKHPTTLNCLCTINAIIKIKIKEKN